MCSQLLCDYDPSLSGIVVCTIGIGDILRPDKKVRYLGHYLGGRSICADRHLAIDLPGVC